MKRIITFILLTILSITSFSQTNEEMLEWSDKGENAFKQGNFKEAIRYYDLIISAYDKNNVKNELYGYYLYFLSSCYFQLNEYNKAVEYESRVMELSKSTLGETHELYIMSLENLGIYYYYLCDYVKAVEYGTKALEICKNTKGESHSDYINLMKQLANYYYYLGDYNNAVTYGIKVLERNKTSLGDKHPQYASSLSSLASYYSAIGDNEKAIELGTQAVQIRKETIGEHHPDYAQSLKELSHYYYALGSYQESLLYCKKSISIIKSIFGDKHLYYASLLNDISVIYSELGDYIKAISNATIALEIQEKILGEHIQCATTIGNLARYYYYLGNYNKAIENGFKAMIIQKTKLGENHPLYATSLNNISQYYSNMGDYARAIEYGNKALSIRKTILGENNPDCALSLNNLSLDYLHIGNYEKALNCARRSLEIRKTVWGEMHPQYASSLHNIAGCFAMLKDYEKAKDYEIKAMNIYKTLYNNNHPSYAISIGCLSDYYYELGNNDKAFAYLLEKLSIYRNNTIQNFCYLPTTQRNYYWDAYSSDFTDVLPSRIYKSNNISASALFNLSALFTKGILLSTEIELKKLIIESGDENAISMFEELQLKKRLLHKLFNKAVEERKLSVDSLFTETEKLERKLLERSKIYDDYSRMFRITWKDVQKSLAADEIAIEFLSFKVLGTDSTMMAALTLRKEDREPKFVPLFEYGQLPSISNSNNVLIPELTELVWRPLQMELSGVNRIYFSPAGVLHKINIENALGMEDYEIIRLSSTREILNLQGKRTIHNVNKTNAILYGGVDYEKRGENTFSEDVNMSDRGDSIYRQVSYSLHRAFVDSLNLRSFMAYYLPSTLMEVQNISASMKQANYPTIVNVGSEATETSFKSFSGRGSSLFHISTHGFYYSEKQARKKDFHNYLRLEEQRYMDAEDKALSRSGLLMAGANLSLKGKDISIDDDDGILTAMEIAQLDLRGTDLVVLSACETGRGDILQGEGVYGLQRGFKKAGVKTIIMSLWKVSDSATGLLMPVFYKHYLAGKSKLESLRMAQKYVREYKDEDGNLLFEDPKYWAAWIILDAID